MGNLRSALVALAVLSWASAARADLEADASRLSDGWRAVGQQIVSRRTVFLDQGKIAAFVPRDAQLGDAACVSVAAIATRGREVVAQHGLLRSAFEPPHVVSEPSVAGVSFFTRCGALRGDALESALEMKSQRGSVEIVIARGPVAAPHPAEVLREREVGALGHPIDPGRPRDPSPLAERVDRALELGREARASSDGVFRMRSNAEGAGAVDLTLPVGCHALTLLGARGLEGRVADLDAELFDVGSHKLVARDRSESSDVHLSPCVAEPTRARLSYVGAPPETEIALVRASFPLAPGAPRRWPGRAKAALSAWLRGRPGPTLLGESAQQAQGTVGTTSIPVDLVPGCQRVVVVASQGEPRALMLSARVAGRTARDDGGLGRVASGLLLCPREPERTVVRVEARGNGVAWVMGVFALTTDAAGAP